jgi:23S rRNA pseudouridine2605 synthase
MMDAGHIRPEYPAALEAMPEGPIRLNRYIASTGLCSRREADEYIKNSAITVNGIIVSELGSKVNLGDEILYNGRKLETEKKVYILLNKPKDYVTTVEDPNAKKTVMELVQGSCPERIYPVGRLDRMTTGVLLLTNDGELTRKLTHPENEMKKIYHVQLDKELTAADFQSIMIGLDLEDGFIRADSLDFTHENDFKKIGIEIHTGRNRIVRRIFEHFGYKVQKLDRVFFAGLTKKGLKRGQWRFLSAKEASYLKMTRQTV